MSFEEAQLEKELKPLHVLHYNSVLSTVGIEIKQCLTGASLRLSNQLTIERKLFGKTLKSIYNEKIESLIEEPTSQEYFENLLQLKLTDWEAVYNLPFLLPSKVKCEPFNGK